jgi:uncharacterized protein YjiS (DUF1127 family)
MATVMNPTGVAGHGNGLSLTDLARRALDVVSVWQERVSSRRQLAGLDAHMLRDIGLSHADVYNETRKPFWRA